MTLSDKTLVDFYLLKDQNQHSIFQFCCRLAEKALKLGNSIQIRTNNPSETELLDDLMWTFSNKSFLPHAKQSENINAPVVIGHDMNEQNCDLLINIATEPPKDIKQFQRIAEILNNDDTIKKRGRVRYTEYKRMGCTVQHHDIAST